MKRFESILDVREKRGLEKGLEKANKKAAITGFQNGVPMNIICLMTGYTEQEVLQIVAEENLQKGK